MFDAKVICTYENENFKSDEVSMAPPEAEI